MSREPRFQSSPLLGVPVVASADDEVTNPPYVPVHLDFSPETLPPTVRHEVGSHLLERGEHEGPLPHAGVREGELRALDGVVTGDEEVDVEGAGAVAHRPHPAGLLLEALGLGEEVVRGEVRFEADDEVEVLVLRRAADGVGLVERGHREGRVETAEPSHGAGEVSLPVPEVGAEPEERSHASPGARPPGVPPPAAPGAPVRRMRTPADSSGCGTGGRVFRTSTVTASAPLTSSALVAMASARASSSRKLWVSTTATTAPTTLP